MAKGIIDNNGRKIEFEPPTPTVNKRGGIYAESVEDTSDMTEVVVGADGKGYCAVNQNVLYAEVVGGIENGNS